jgi:beta-glucosidase-like glycosyl hydrolase
VTDRAADTDGSPGLARLVLPALRWDDGTGWGASRSLIELSLDLGVGGFLVFGGPAAAVRELCVELHERAPHPLLVASDLERGAGQQFVGATRLPPCMALGSIGSDEVVERAGELTAREARALGVNWVFAPVADLDAESVNPIVGTRAFGSDAETVARFVAAWVRGCRRGGALSTPKHFPGHGRTVADSHIELPLVDAPAHLLEQDILPFRRAIEAGADSLMTAHVAYPALEPEPVPATISRRIMHDLLRRELGFDGLVVTDALDMAAVSASKDERTAAVEAIAAGCDMILCMSDPAAVVVELRRALAGGRLRAERVDEALRRVERAAARVAGGARGEWGRDEDRRWALRTAVGSLRVARGSPALPAGPVRVVEVDDDLGGPHPADPRTAFTAALRARGVDVARDGAPVLVVYSDVRAWKGRPGLSADAAERVERASRAAPDAPVVLFAHPRLAHELAEARNVLVAWGGEALMQEAAAEWLAGKRGSAGPRAG